MAEKIPTSHHQKGKKRGPRFRISDEYLSTTRNHLFWLFDTTWADLAWKLKRVVSADDVPIALKRLSDSDQFPIKILLRPLSTLGPFEKIRSLEQRVEQMKDQLERLRQSVAADSKKLDRIERMALIASKRDRIALEADRTELQARLNVDKQREVLLTSEQRSALMTLEDARAYFARSELVKFCQSGRSRKTPRRFANAVAGLPFVSCRSSGSRCVKLENEKSAGQYRYAVIKVIKTIVESCPTEGELVTHARTYLENRRSVPANVFADLRLKFRCLRLSIEQVMAKKSPIGARPYKIASEYFRRTSQPGSELEMYLTEKESITRKRSK